MITIYCKVCILYIYKSIIYIYNLFSEIYEQNKQILIYNKLINIKLEDTLKEISLLKKIIDGKMNTGILVIYELSIIINIYKKCV